VNIVFALLTDEAGNERILFVAPVYVIFPVGASMEFRVCA
jgi:hypothetical protein